MAYAKGSLSQVPQCWEDVVNAAYWNSSSSARGRRKYFICPTRADKQPAFAALDKPSMTKVPLLMKRSPPKGRNAPHLPPVRMPTSLYSGTRICVDGILRGFLLKYLQESRFSAHRSIASGSWWNPPGVFWNHYPLSTKSLKLDCAGK